MAKSRALLKSLLITINLSVMVIRVSAQSEDREIRGVVDNMFKGMRSGDSSLVRSTFLNSAFMSSFSNNTKDSLVLHFEKSIDEFVKAVGTPHKEIWDERIYDVKISRDGPMAIVWAPYKFYLGETFSHCGVNVFTLVHTKSEWKIREITDTRRKDKCQ